MRFLWLAPVLFLLSACNVVISYTPMFTKADEAGAPRLKPGIWTTNHPPSCLVDERKPLAAWPECATGAMIAPGVVGSFTGTGAERRWDRDPFVLAAGDPRIGEVHFRGTMKGRGEGAVEGAAWGYAGVRPLKFDRQGRIIEVSYWVVQCGPPPPPSPNPPAKGEPAHPGTLHPLPGLAMTADRAVCTPDSAAAVRNAAKASEAWADKPVRLHWIRSGTR
jgi:hypothetical protein